MEKSKIIDLRVLSFFGSPRNAGYSARIHDAFLHNFSGDRTVRISAYGRGIIPCTACGQCKTTFRCVNRDMDEIFDALSSSDILTFSWPVYFSSAPSPMKAVIDRFQPVWEAASSGMLDFSPKKIFYFLTSGSDYRTVFQPSITMIRYIAATIGAQVIDSYSVTIPGLDTYDGKKNFEYELNKLKSENIML